MKPRIFISHSHQDNEFVHKIAKDLAAKGGLMIGKLKLVILLFRRYLKESDNKIKEKI